MSGNNKNIFGALDLEIAFYDCKSLLDTGLISFEHEHAGFKGCRDQMQKPDAVALIEGFLEGVQLLEKHGPSLIRWLWSWMHGKIGRVIIQDTQNYRTAIEKGNFESFETEERMQLEVGDIPYFFCVYGKKEVYFWSSKEEVDLVSSAKLLARSQPFLICDIDSYLGSPHRRSSQMHSIAQLIALFVSSRSELKGQSFHLKRLETKTVFESNRFNFQFQNHITSQRSK